jgi:hypothetical protein
MKHPAIMSNGREVNLILINRLIFRSSHPSDLLCDGVVSLDFAHHCADGNLEEHIVAAFPAFALALSISSSASLDNTPSRKFVQTRQALDSLNVDAASAAAITAVGRPFFNVLLA